MGVQAWGKNARATTLPRSSLREIFESRWLGKIKSGALSPTLRWVIKILLCIIEYRNQLSTFIFYNFIHYRVSLISMIPNNDTTLTVDDVISRIGFGRFQRKLLWICGFGWAADAMEVLLISFVIPAVAKEWSLSKGQIGWLGTAIFLGMMTGAWFWGRLSDRIGRKFGFIGTIAIDSGFRFALCFCAIICSGCLFCGH